MLISSMEEFKNLKFNIFDKIHVESNLNKTEQYKLDSYQHRESDLSTTGPKSMLSMLNVVWQSKYRSLLKSLLTAKYSNC